MIVYSATTAQFLTDTATNVIHQRIIDELKRRTGKRVGASEITSWRNSMQFMASVVSGADISDQSNVSIEYTIPLTSKRVDFILSGKNEKHQNTAVVVELKQWSKVEKTGKDAIVESAVGGGVRELLHPSYQAWTYAALIEDYNETVREESIQLKPCAYLHNLDSAEAINDPFYKAHTDNAPVFISSDAAKLSRFLEQHVKHADVDNVMYRIEHGKIKPSKMLADSLRSMIDGNPEFLMIDDQKVVYESSIDLAHKAAQVGKPKQVLIVEGGPGTGKSVVAVNLLVEMTRRELVASYISKNAAPRDVFAAKLTGTMTKTRINTMFRGSGAFTETPINTFDVLIVDEAHRLNEKSGLFSNLGENQIKELINAARLTVFFLDESQRVTLKDIGSKNEIMRWALDAGAEVEELTLASQFRCNGSDGYLAWVDNALQIRETANDSLDGAEYEFKVFDDPEDLRAAIVQKNRVLNKSRLVAGYCWDWASKKDPAAMDIQIGNFEAQWNLTKDGGLWIMSPESVSEIGCIHTCQGLELDYVGVIIGDDLIVRDGAVITDGSKRSRMDASIKGLKKMAKADPKAAQIRADEIIKNTYRTLMTRGQKGCYLYCTDDETREYFKSLLQLKALEPVSPETHKDNFIVAGLDVIQSDTQPEGNVVPIFDLQAAAGAFSDYQTLNSGYWVELPDVYNRQAGMFVVQVKGESMNRRIPNGAWCLFSADPGGSRQGKTVLVRHSDIQDPDFGGQFTVKRYESEKRQSDTSEWEHSMIRLMPDSSQSDYQPIELRPSEDGELEVFGVLVSVLV
tara:strand:+ start:18720 stop:21113 length:2394 start_codon:yes stop_codon:yes gene_type:complete